MVYVVISSLWELLEANERDSSTGGLQRTSEVLLNLVSLPGNKASKYLLLYSVYTNV